VSGSVDAGDESSEGRRVSTPIRSVNLLDEYTVPYRPLHRNQAVPGLMVSRVLGVVAPRNDENASASAGLGATWPGSEVVAEGVEMGSVASCWTGSEVRQMGGWSRNLLYKTDATFGGQRSG